MAKKVKSFKSLTQADQISLLKGGSIELLIIRAVLTYDKDKGHFLDPADQEETSAMSMQQLARCETVCHTTTHIVNTQLPITVCCCCRYHYE